MNKIIGIIILLLSFTLSGSSTGNTETKFDVDSVLIKMFEHANAHNLGSLTKLGETIKPYDNHTLNIGYFLALYLAAPEIYKRQFVENFPINYEGISYDLYESIELKQLTPSFLYSFNSLGLIAVEGDIKAIKKVILGAIHSDGVISQTFCEYVVKALDVQQNKAISEYSELPKKEREKSYMCFDVASADELAPVKEKLEKLKIKVPASEALVIDEIDKYISHILANQKY